MKEHTKFTVIIPTRNRADTLQWSLKTCVEQDYKNLEIIISDNSSEDNTRNVVDSYKDSRIKYINTGRPLSMTGNYEFALSHLSDGYFTLLGDDDGLMPGALKKANEILSQSDYEAIVGRIDEYFWNNCTSEEKKGMLHYHVSDKSRELSTTQMIQNVLSLKNSYQNIPCIYNTGFVSVKLFNDVKQKSGGKFFHSCIPDVYSAFALSSQIDKYLFVNTTFILTGVSGHSNGIAYFDPKGNRQIVSNFFAYDTIPFHQKLVMSPSMAIMYAESYLQAKDAGLFSEDLSIKKIAETAMKEATSSIYYLNYDEIKSAVARIIEINNIDKKFEYKLFSKYNKNEYVVKSIIRKITNRIFSPVKSIKIFTDVKKIDNIHDAVMFNYNLENKKKISGIKYKLSLLHEILRSGKNFIRKKRSEMTYRA